MRCEFIAIGTELLLGQIVNSNAAWLGEQLALAGIDCLYQVTIGDNRQRMKDTITQALEPLGCRYCKWRTRPNSRRHHERSDS